MADVIQLILTAKNDASKTITQIEKDIARLNKTTANVGSVDKALSALGTGLAIGAFTATVGMIVEGTAQLSQAGANVDRLRYSFEKLAAQNGTSGAQIISAIESVTQGTLSQQQIMEQANAAMLLGVADTADEFSTLAKIAVDRGRAMGISMEYAFESIVKGVGRMSPLILDNLGIVIDADTTYANYAKTLGKTADALTDVEKRQALISKLKVEVADFDPDTVNDAASAWEKLAAAQDNAVAAAGSWINTNTISLSVLERLTIALDQFSGSVSNDPMVQIKGLNAELARLKEHDIRPSLADFLASLKQTGGDTGLFGLPTLDKLLRDLNASDIEKVNAELKSLQDTMNEDWKTANMGKILPDPAKAAELAAELAAAAKEIEVMEEYTKRVASEMGEGKEAAAALVRETVDTAGSLDAAIPSLNNLVDGLRQAREEAKAMNAAISGATSGFDSAVFGAFEDSGFNMDVIAAAKTARVAFDEALVSIENAGYSLYDTEAAALMAEAQFSESFLEISQAVDDATASIGGAAKKTASLSEEFRGLQGIVGGLLSTASQDIGGLDLDSILPREDAISENARRLAAIANEGLIDQSWLEEFKNEAPGTWADLMLKVARGTDVKTAAAELLRDFQNGLKPELIDKGKLKEIAKRMFMVDQSTKAMIDEIATELANEMNISIEDAKALVGSAAGVKRVLTDEEKQKIVDEKLGGLEAAVGFKFGTRDSILKSGIDSGLFNADGNFVVFASLEAPSGLVISQKPKLEIGEVDTSDASSALSFSLPPITIPSTLAVDANAFATQINGFNDSKVLTATITFPAKVGEVDTSAVSGSLTSSLPSVNIPSILVIDSTAFEEQVKGLSGNETLTATITFPAKVGEVDTSAAYDLLNSSLQPVNIRSILVVDSAAFTEQIQGLKDSSGLVPTITLPIEVGELDDSASSGLVAYSLPSITIPSTVALDASVFATQIQEFNDSKVLATPIALLFDADNTQVAASAMNSFAVWANAFAMPENIATFSSAFGGVIFNAIVEKNADFILAGVTVSMGIVDGFKSTNTGTAIAAEISKQLFDNAAKIEQSGQAVGRTWGKGFLDVVGANIPLDLLNILTDLITPEVLAEVRKQQGMEGAK